MLAWLTSAATSTTHGSMGGVKAVFSDLDGTLVHFPAWFEAHGSKIVRRDPTAGTATVRSPDGQERACRLLPSSTMGDGLVSERTVELIDELRALGVLFVVVTAARKSTLLERLPLLPAVDVAVGETGSRIYVDGVLDEAWADGLREVCGPLDREMPPEERPEMLWRWLRRLQQVPGLKVDGRSYYGCFRVDTKGSAEVEAVLLKVIGAELPAQVDWAMNLGKVTPRRVHDLYSPSRPCPAPTPTPTPTRSQYDFYPRASGKGNAVAYLQRRYSLAPEQCVALFDDDNDLPMARRCEGGQLLPGLTSKSVARAALEHPEWKVAARAGQGVFAIEELLESLLEQVRSERRVEADAVDTPEEEEEEVLVLPREA